MRVAHVNNSSRGGAARVAQALIAARRGDALFVAKANAQDDVTRIDPKPDAFLARHCTSRGLFFCQCQGSHDLPKTLAGFDLCHLHNIHGDYFNPFSLLILDRAMPMVWTLHDMFAITGRCVHSFDCDRWQDGCGACAVFGDGVGAASGLWHKRLIYGQLAAEIVAPSRWLADVLAKSVMRDMRVTCIPNGIDTQVFVPPEYNVLRARYGIADDTVLVGSSAAGGVLEQELKGASFAEPFMRALAAAGIKAVFVNIGSSAEGRRGDVIDVPFSADDRVLAEVYGSLDMFVLFSKGETSPLVVREAASCGVPCAAFAVGGIPEVIVHGETGVLAKPYDVGDLVAQTAAFLRATRRRGNVKARVRDHALRCFDVRMMTMAYGKVYARAQQRFAVAARKEPYVISPIAATKDFADASCGAGAPFSVVREGVSAQEAVLAVAYEVYARARSGSGATLLAEKMMADNAPSVELEYLLGDAMRMGGRAADALAWFMKMYRKNPRELSLLIGAGESLRDMERHAEAKACAAAALKAAPHDERIRAFARTLSVI